jgi:hypothetical protein
MGEVQTIPWPQALMARRKQKHYTRALVFCPLPALLVLENGR